MSEALQKLEIRILGKKGDESLLAEICEILNRYLAFKVDFSIVSDDTDLSRNSIDKLQSDPSSKFVLVPLFENPDIKKLMPKDECVAEPVSPAKNLGRVVMTRVKEALTTVSNTAHVVASTDYVAAYKSNNVIPSAIMDTSVKIVRSRIAAESRLLTQEQSAVVERIVHATADPEYAKLTFITKDAVSAGITAVENGNPIVTDVEMVKAGLTRDRLKEFSIKVLTYIDDPRSSEAAKIQGTTRAAAAMSVAASEGIDGCIIAIGNAPTAAAQIVKLVNEGKVKPSVIVATPVGFVGAAKAKEEVSRLRTPHIIVSGEKGGSSAAAAAVNAFLALASDKKKSV